MVGLSELGAVSCLSRSPVGGAASEDPKGTSLGVR